MATALVAVAVLLAGCSGGTVSAPSGAAATALPAAGTSLSPADFAAAAKLPNTVLLDVRTPSEFAAGHIAVAVNLDVQSPAFTQAVTTLDTAKSYAVYCHSGNRSKTAMSAMQQHGIRHVFDLDGGIAAWQSAGGQIATG